MRLLKMHSFLLWITKSKVAAITLCPFGIYFKTEQNMSKPKLVNHEKIHWKQQIEMLILPFYIWYLIEWLCKRSYETISFEREANNYENQIDYISKRKHYSWIKYLKND